MQNRRLRVLDQILGSGTEVHDFFQLEVHNCIRSSALQEPVLRSQASITVLISLPSGFIKPGVFWKIHHLWAMGDFPIDTSICMGFSIAMFDYRRVDGIPRCYWENRIFWMISSRRVLLRNPGF